MNINQAKEKNQSEISLPMYNTPLPVPFLLYLSCFLARIPCLWDVPAPTDPEVFMRVNYPVVCGYCIMIHMTSSDVSYLGVCPFS
jgi:hypothetical protein